MTIFNDLYAWADEAPSVHAVHACMAAVYDKANQEETFGSPDFAASSEGLAWLDENGILTANFSVFLTDTDRRKVWRVRFLRDGNIDMHQIGWTRDWRRMTDVRRVDAGSGDFATGHFQNRSTRALMSFSFDKIKDGLV